LIQIDAAPERIGVNFPSYGLVGDAKPTLRALIDRIPQRGDGNGESRVAAVRERVSSGLAEMPSGTTTDLLEIIEDTLPEGAAATWDSTILAYAACWYLRVAEPRRFLYPAGSSTLGYAWPAALGVAAGQPAGPVLAIAGDGGFQYGIAELATARQHGLDTTLLLIDDRGYGILREYQDAADFAHTGVDLDHADFAALADAYGIPSRRSSVEHLGRDLTWALEHRGPAIVLLEEVLAMPVPTG
jgi:acetolactate synthase-1/2/3 large subunit